MHQQACGSQRKCLEWSDEFVIPGEAQRRPGIQFLYSTCYWIPAYAVMTKDDLSEHPLLLVCGNHNLSTGFSER
jgi:hypothetical protein